MIQDATRLPVIAAGGLATAAQVVAVMHSGAQAIMVGTALLRTSESGASAVHQAAIAAHSRDASDETVLTRSFTGRPARGVRNQFTDQFDALAPSGYPAVHHLTSPIRKAATATGDPGAVHLWAGTGYRLARPGPAADVLLVHGTPATLGAWHRSGQRHADAPRSSLSGRNGAMAAVLAADALSLRRRG